MLIIYYFFLLINFSIYLYLFYIWYSIFTKQTNFLWKEKLDKFSNIIFKDLFETKLKKYEPYKNIILMIIVSIFSSILLGLIGHVLISSEIWTAQDQINQAMNHLNKVQGFPNNITK